MKRILYVSMAVSVAGVLVGTSGVARAADTPHTAPQSGSLAPGTTGPGTVSTAPVETPAQMAAREALMRGVNLPGPRLPEERTPSSLELPAPSTQTGLQSSRAPATFSSFRSWTFNPSLTAGNEAAVNEPSLGQSGRIVLQTYNWYAALSTNGGVTFSFISPYTKFPAADGGFCCDQDAIYDPSRDLLFWLLQYVRTASGNRLRLAVANGEANQAAANFSFYDLTTAFLGQGTGNWLDYPHLALSNNFLYITVNVFTPADAWLRTLVIRASLDQLRAGGSVTFSWFNITSNFTLTPVQGAKEVMYLGSHESTSSIRIFSWPDNSNTLSSVVVGVPAWTQTVKGSATCTTPDGDNPCARFDQRITAGWLDRGGAGGRIGFFWNVKQGAGFPFPYINAARFRETTKAFLDRPLIWTTAAAWFYGAAGVNARDDLGIAAFFAGGGNYPRWCVGIDDDYNGDPPGWEIGACPFWSGNSPDADKWGDYHRVRPFHPSALTWVGSGYRTSCGADSGCAWPSGLFFGRERDTGSWQRWQNK